MYSFIRNLVGVKTDQAVNSAVEAIVRWDPKSATEAELRTMEQQLDQLGRQVAEARQAFEKEKREADAIQNLSQQRMAAAEHLQKQMSGESDSGRKSELERSLTTLVAMLEGMSGDIEREKRDADDAGEFLHSLEDTYQQAGQKLKGARDALTRAQRDMSRADQQRDMAERRAEAARQAAGLSGRHQRAVRRVEGDAGQRGPQPGHRRGGEREGQAAGADTAGAGRQEHRPCHGPGAGQASRPQQQHIGSSGSTAAERHQRPGAADSRACVVSNVGDGLGRCSTTLTPALSRKRERRPAQRCAPPWMKMGVVARVGLVWSARVE